MSEGRLEKKKPVYDNVYGFVFLTDEEYKLVDSMYFHRLRWINQLGMAFYTFPGALHNRFSHSIGVLHLVDRIFENLHRNIGNTAVDVETERITRLAALLHDIGHYPLSHTVEQSYMMNQAVRHWDKAKDLETTGDLEDEGPPDYLGNPKSLEEFFLVDFADKLEPKIKPLGESANHERFAGSVIRSQDMAEELRLADDDIDRICSIIRGDVRGDWQDSVLAKTIINSLVDADSLDYMLRDAYFTGVKLGVYDIDNILRKVTIVSENGYDCLGFERDCIQSIESFLLAKYYWYSQIIYHYRVLIYDEIAKYFYFHLLCRENSNGWQVLPFDKLARDIVNQGPEYLKFTDSYFWRVVRNIVSDEVETVMGKMAKVLLYRENPYYVPFTEWPEDLAKEIATDKRIVEQQETGIPAMRLYEFDNATHILLKKNVEIFKNLSPDNKGKVERKTVRMGKGVEWSDIHDMSGILQFEGDKYYEGYFLYRFNI